MNGTRTCALALLFCGTFNAEAYFLSGAQKGQLFVDGVIRDTSGNTYNVRVVPGYALTGSLFSRHWKQGASDQMQGGEKLGRGLVEIPSSLRRIGEYGSPRPYRGIAEGLDESWRGEQYLFGTFMGSDLVSAWGDYWKGARRAHERRSFGWWFAYPWATGKGVTNSTLRLGGGTVGAAAVAGYGLVLRPAYEILRPIGLITADAGRGTVKVAKGSGLIAWGTGRQAIMGTAVPLAAAGWTTTIAPPMALLGRAPTPRSVDGWWVTMLPGSPDYTLSLDPDSKFRLEDPDAVLAYETDAYMLKGLTDSLDAERSARVRDLNDEITKTWNTYSLKKDSVRQEVLGERKPPVRRVSRKLLTQERAYLDTLVRARLEPNPTYQGMSSDDRDALVDRIVTEWGPNLIATPFDMGKGPSYKSHPATLLGEEVDQILGSEGK